MTVVRDVMLIRTENVCHVTARVPKVSNVDIFIPLTAPVYFAQLLTYNFMFKVVML